MFGWLKRLFAPRGVPLDLYHPGERAIFKYFDGKSTIAVDPMVLWRAFEQVRGDLHVAYQVSRSPSKDAGKMYGEMVRHIRTIFGVKPYDGGGLTELECIELLDQFMMYCDDVKKNSSPPPTSPTATPVPSASSSAEGPPTPSSSASGSIGEGSTTAVPGPSPSAVASPSA